MMLTTTYMQYLYNTGLGMLLVQHQNQTCCSIICVKHLMFVLKEARDKLVITCLEWIRRYVMKRNIEKWEGIQEYEGRFMPYVGKVLQWIGEVARKCEACLSREDEWEVETTNDRFVVNLKTIHAAAFTGNLLAYLAYMHMHV